METQQIKLIKVFNELGEQEGEELELSEYISINTAEDVEPLEAEDIQRLNSMEIGETIKIVGFVGCYSLIKRTH